MRIRERLTYSNAAATLALVVALGTGGAYAAEQLGSNDIKNNSIRSADLKNRKAVRGKDVRNNTLGARTINERGLHASQFAPLAHGTGSCNPGDAAPEECVETTIGLDRRGRILIIAAGNFYAETGGARLTCELEIDESGTGAGAVPGEESTDNSDLAATNGFAVTHVSAPLQRGDHEIALVCSQVGSPDARLGTSSIAVLGISR